MVRKRFKDQVLMANTGYGTNKKGKHMLPSGFQKFLVHNVKELEVLLMCSKPYCAEAVLNAPPRPQSIPERASKVAISNQSQCQTVQFRK
ncbi:60S ribosomal protein L32 [Sciurus carolinensis]|uniref:60S ribosomal protein L32 n=1 Tax=Sciurus carolinensis TaxID=30640 RepID=A0AA41NBE5_SCICA|nr:60S ribosomal protein L32 [Sciurus carolinensis]